MAHFSIHFESGVFEDTFSLYVHCYKRCLHRALLCGQVAELVADLWALPRTAPDTPVALPHYLLGAAAPGYSPSGPARVLPVMLAVADDA